MYAQRVGWSTTVEASGTVLFGNSTERIAASRVQLARADSTLEVRSDARLRYAEAKSDSGARRVTGRAWITSLALDYRPFARVSPFGFSSIEANLQLGIARRTSAGGGAKYTFLRGADDEMSVSLALLAERTRAVRSSAPGTASSNQRWSLRVRGRRHFGNIALSHVTFFQPTVADVDRFTVSTTTTLGVGLTGSLELTASLEAVYDSEARRRGALHNHDGQSVFGIRASF
jgi:hypothetical protein